MTTRFLGRCKVCGTKRGMDCVDAGSMPDPRNPAYNSHYFVDALGIKHQENALGHIFATCTCGARVSMHTVRGTVNGAIKCDGRCESAIGETCECSCGGANHGASHCEVAHV